MRTSSPIRAPKLVDATIDNRSPPQDSDALVRHLVAGLGHHGARLDIGAGADDRVADKTEMGDAEHAFYIGRAAGHAVAMEGALKLKEITYLHAEAYPASELKHGPLALVTPQTPTVIVLPRDDLFAKNVSTIEEIKARGGPVIAVAHPGEVHAAFDKSFEVPQLEPELDPLLLNIPLQLLAYHVARQRGCDIDKPRNLAKSVAVG
jgi:glucosamine--fructose-6-phosphate aminotransferase (isomerizing)